MQTLAWPDTLRLMLTEAAAAKYQWLRAGNEAFPAMLAAIDAAQSSVCLETYTYAAGSLGERVREALVRAQGRGARVRVLYDALGSRGLPGTFWQPLQAAGGEVRQFNPLAVNRLGIRDHRKLLVCDERVAFVGGFNIAPEYEGDGVTSGWRDLGLRIEGLLAAELVAAFEEMFERADFQHRHFLRLRKSTARKTVRTPSEQLLLSGFPDRVTGETPDRFDACFAAFSLFSETLRHFECMEAVGVERAVAHGDDFI